MIPSSSRRFHKARLFLMGLLLWGGLGLFGAGRAVADEEWTRDNLDRLIEKIQSGLYEPGDPKERLEGPFWDYIFDKLKNMIVALGRQTGMSLGEVRREVVQIINSIDGLKETDSADVTMDEKNQTVSMHYYRHLPEFMARELDLPTKWEVFQVDVMGISSRLFKGFHRGFQDACKKLLVFRDILAERNV